MAFNVLVVDDSAVMRAMVIKTLRLSGVPVGEVYQAAHGEEGLERLRDHWVDLVLLDLNMPQMNGEELLAEIRSHPDTASVAVIVVSTEGSEARIKRIKDLGAEFVHKPFRPEELRAVIRDLTGVSDDTFDAVPAVSNGSSDF
ncbi:MAG: response regulator [Gemmatimonadota bacterium]|nr:response regulator [Gemmatimonadota bacterium]